MAPPVRLVATPLRPSLRRFKASRKRASFVFAKQPTSRSLSTTALPWQPLSFPASISLSLSYLDGPFQRLRDALNNLWEGLLRAVPKKKPSKSQTRKRRNHGGRALKDEKNFVSCSSCGRPKRAHILCSYCVQNIIDTRAGDSNADLIKSRLRRTIEDMDPAWKQQRRTVLKAPGPKDLRSIREAPVRERDESDVGNLKRDYNTLVTSRLWKARTHTHRDEQTVSAR